LLAIMPTNKRLQSIPAGEAGQVSRALLKKWGRLHAARTMLGFSAVMGYGWALN